MREIGVCPAVTDLFTGVVCGIGGIQRATQVVVGQL